MNHSASGEQRLALAQEGGDPLSSIPSLGRHRETLRFLLEPSLQRYGLRMPYGLDRIAQGRRKRLAEALQICLLYTSDAADE